MNFGGRFFLCPELAKHGASDNVFFKTIGEAVNKLPYFLVEKKSQFFNHCIKNKSKLQNCPSFLPDYLLIIGRGKAKI
jgi:hypothetical protein